MLESASILVCTVLDRLLMRLPRSGLAHLAKLSLVFLGPRYSSGSLVLAKIVSKRAMFLLSHSATAVRYDSYTASEGSLVIMETRRALPSLICLAKISSASSILILLDGIA